VPSHSRLNYQANQALCLTSNVHCAS